MKTEQDRHRHVDRERERQMKQAARRFRQLDAEARSMGSKAKLANDGIGRFDVGEPEGEPIASVELDLDGRDDLRVHDPTHEERAHDRALLNAAHTPALRLQKERAFGKLDSARPGERREREHITRDEHRDGAEGQEHEGLAEPRRPNVEAVEEDDGGQRRCVADS